MYALIYGECMLDEVYEAMDSPGGNTPPLPPHQSRTDTTGSNKYMDSHGYLKIYHSNMDNTATTADAQPRTDSLSDHSELSDAAN